MEAESMSLGPSEWTNYGDVNPDDWGGRFIRREGDEWHVVVTIPPGDLPDGLSTEGHLVEQYDFEPQDVWVDGDPRNGLTSDMERIVGSFGEGERVSDGTHILLNPDNPEFGDAVPYYVVDLTHYIESRRGYGEPWTWIHDDEYWDELSERFGIEPE